MSHYHGLEVHADAGLSLINTPAEPLHATKFISVCGRLDVLNMFDL